MKRKKSLPLIGVGPFYVIPIIFITVAVIVLSILGCIPVKKFPAFQGTFLFLGIVCVLFGIFMWLKAVFYSRIDTYIKQNKLVKTGIYSYVRNPIYSAFLFLCTGVLLIYHNVNLFVLPFFYWIYMTVFLKKTEEKWLYQVYGEEYLEYCKMVNRCIPWFPKNNFMQIRY